MKIFRHTNGFLYTIEQPGRGKLITPPRDWNNFFAYPAWPYCINKNVPALGPLGKEPNLEGFTLEFEI